MTDHRKNFMRYVELHERAWGMDKYAGRPSLQEIMNAPVVAFWYLNNRRETRFVATLHQDVKELNAYASQLVVHSSKIRHPEKRLTKLFVQGREVLVKGVKFSLTLAEN